MRTAAWIDSCRTGPASNPARTGARSTPPRTSARSTWPRFTQRVTVVFGVGNASEPHHLPLLLVPFAYTTYRGS